MSGAEIAQKRLRDNGISNVSVISVPGQLNDHYNPVNRSVNLSAAVYSARNAAAAAVAAHWWDMPCNMPMRINGWQCEVRLYLLLVLHRSGSNGSYWRACCCQIL